MRRIILSFMPIILTACTVQSQDGNDVRLEQPFILSEQRWSVTQQFVAPEGERICSVSAGELQITQHGHNHSVEPQVAISYKLDPGDYYKVLVAGHYYETVTGWFDAKDSEAIVHDLTTSDIVYTERRTRAVGNIGEWRSIDNKIPLRDFAATYKQCTAFVTSRK